MTHKIINTKSNKIIHVFDEVFSYQTRTLLHRYMMNSNYQPIGYDNDILEYKSDITTISLYSDNDVKNMNFYGNLEGQFLSSYLTGYETNSISVNMCTPSDKYRIHMDAADGLTLLYYANLKWDIEWGGETLFFDEELNDIEFTSIYKPGRIVLFDSSIPHMARTPTVIAPYYRFTFVHRFQRAKIVKLNDVIN